MNIHLVRELTEQYRRGGRVVVGHMAKLSLLPPDEVAALARQLADAGIARDGAAGDRPLPDGARPDHSVRARRRRRQPPPRARRQLLALVQQHPQSGDALWRLLAHPHGEPLRQCPAGRPPGAASRMLRHAHGALGAAAEPQGLRLRGRQPGRHRHHRRASPEQAIAEIRAAARGVQARPAHGDAATAPNCIVPPERK